MQAEILACVGASPVFAGLPSSVIAEVAKVARLRAVAAGRLLVSQGMAADRFGILFSGRARMTQVTNDGRQIALRYIIAGQEFGLLAVLPGFTYPLSIEAVDACEVLCWAGTRLADLFLRYPQVGLNALQIMVIRNQELQARYRELLTDRAEQRLARALVRLSVIAGEDAGQGRLITLPLTREDLAELIGATLFTVSRTLSQWEQAKIVITGRERIMICRQDVLEQIAGEPEPAAAACFAPCALAEVVQARRNGEAKPAAT